MLVHSFDVFIVYLQCRRNENEKVLTGIVNVANGIIGRNPQTTDLGLPGCEKSI